MVFECQIVDFEKLQIFSHAASSVSLIKKFLCKKKAYSKDTKQNILSYS